IAAMCTGRILGDDLASRARRTPAHTGSDQRLELSDANLLLVRRPTGPTSGRRCRRFHCAPTCGGCAVRIRDRHLIHTGGRSPGLFPGRRPWHTGDAGGRAACGVTEARTGAPTTGGTVATRSSGYG